jgi:hypothetical protein
VQTWLSRNERPVVLGCVSSEGGACKGARARPRGGVVRATPGIGVRNEVWQQRSTVDRRTGVASERLVRTWGPSFSLLDRRWLAITKS